jgi:hypothetical protein
VSISVLKLGPARRVDPGPGRPGPGTGPGGGKNPFGSWPGETRSTRQVDPGPSPPGWDPVYFFFILIDVKRRRFGLCFKGQNDEEQWSGIGHIDYRANLINKKNQFQSMSWGAEESRRRLDHCCFTAKKVSLLFLFTNLLLSLSLFFIFGRVLNLQFWASFCCSLIQSRWFSRNPSYLNLRYVSLFFLFCSVINPLLLGSVENGWGN